MGSPALMLDWRLPESSVKVPDSTLAFETGPEPRECPLPRVAIAPSGKFERPECRSEKGDISSPNDDWGERRFPFERARLGAWSSGPELETTDTPSSPLYICSPNDVDWVGVEWLLRNGRKMDSSIKSWMSFTEVSSF